jgi:translation initiation factor IF-2
MKLVDIARELRITTQELRHELQKTNFGVSPTAHEVDDAIGKGILRFLKGKVKPTLTHRRAAMVFKDDKEIVIEEEKPKVVEEKEEPKEEKEEEPKEEKKDTAALEDRSRIPKPGMVIKPAKSVQVVVNRRIEIGKPSKPVSEASLPKNYYNTSTKKKRKGRGGSDEEKVLETLGRHSRQVRKAKVARVSYAVGEVTEGLTAEEIAIERELDSEAFRDQKKHRALSQRTGHKAQPQIKAKTGVVELPGVLNVKEFCEKCGLTLTDVLKTLAKNGVMATINQKIDYDTAAIVAGELGVEVKLKQMEATSDELFERDIQKLIKEEDKSLLKPRAPVVTIMGHVDHGKTKLLDTIRSANVMATESGGITQHIGAYQVVKNGRAITFLDTPGHEAFTAMRARGAKVTDIAILVVAADEGVMPQTEEAIAHIKEAGVPIIVALNKIDKPTANLDKIKGELGKYDLIPEEWGGKTPMVPVSALTGQNIDKLLEMILLVADIAELKANPNRLAVGTVIESNLDPNMGPVATILVSTGTLKIGNDIVVGSTVGRVKAMHNHKGELVAMAGPSAAVRISGLSAVPQAGDILQAFKDTKTARDRAEEIKRLTQLREEELSGSMADRIVAQINAGKVKQLKVVIKADTKGSMEAILKSLSEIKSTDVAVKVIHYGIGNVASTDVIMAAASQALLLSFHVDVSTGIKKEAEKEHVDIRQYTVIYKMVEDMERMLAGMLEPEIRTVELGKLSIQQIFLDKKKWVIAGCRVDSGKIQRGAQVRLVRNGEMIFDVPLESLRHVNEEVKELDAGSECGIRISTPKPVVVGDILEAYKIEKIERTLLK